MTQLDTPKEISDVAIPYLDLVETMFPPPKEITQKPPYEEP